jgi:hypothetical protein
VFCSALTNLLYYSGLPSVPRVLRLQVTVGEFNDFTGQTAREYLLHFDLASDTMRKVSHKRDGNVVTSNLKCEEYSEVRITKRHLGPRGRPGHH